MMTVAFAIAIAIVLGFTIWALTRGRTPELPKDEQPVQAKLEKKAPPAPVEPKSVTKPLPAAGEGSPTKEQAAARAEGTPAAAATDEASAEALREAAADAAGGAQQERAQSIDAMRKGLASTRGGFISRLAKLFGENRTINPALLEEIDDCRRLAARVVFERVFLFGLALWSGLRRFAGSN